MSFDPRPPAPRTGQFDKHDIEDHVAIFIEPKHEQIPTKFNVAGQDAARCSFVVDVDTGKVYSDAVIFGAALWERLTSDPGSDVVVGTLTMTNTQNGNSLWILNDPDADELVRACEWLDVNAKRDPGTNAIFIDDSF